MNFCRCCERECSGICNCCRKPICGACYFGRNGFGIGHKHRCNYHGDGDEYETGKHECESNKCPDPQACDHDLNIDGNDWKTARENYLK